jgi:hypothetical protein
LQAVAEGPEDVVGADGSLAACRVVVEGDEDPGLAKIGGAAERCGLAAGQGGAAGGQAGVVVRVGQDDGDRVEGSFCDDGGGAVGEVTTGVVKSEQQVTFVVGAGGWSVQIFRYGGTVPFDLGRFVAGLERQWDRPIQLRPFTSGPGCPCGLWIGTADADYIYHEAGTTPFHRTHIALHEIAHMLLGHRHTAACDQILRLLAPDVDQALIHLILGRSAYSTAEEREAEILASIILSNAASQR